MILQLNNRNQVKLRDNRTTVSTCLETFTLLSIGGKPVCVEILSSATTRCFPVQTEDSYNDIILGGTGWKSRIYSEISGKTII